MPHDFEWKPEYSVHVQKIDDQHKQLLKLIFKLFNAINTNLTKNELGEILEELIEYAGYHFATEEMYFREFDYENADEHIREHRKFSKKMLELQKNTSIMKL